MAKSSIVFECSNCGAQCAKWAGQCGECGKWNTLIEQVAANKSGKVATIGKLLNISEIEGNEAKRVPTGIDELDRVLGGGLVAGEVVLMIGEPGIGKSTLLTQLALRLSQGKKVAYVCGEESPSQVKLRIERLLSNNKQRESKINLEMLAETDVDVIVATLQKVDLSLVIVDSVQTLSTTALTGMAGNVGQIRECTARLIAYAKTKNVPVVLVGHVTKDGEMAGPKVLEHMVDAVLELTGDRYHDLRLLRTQKNRFGATDEVGVFRMDESGMTEVTNPSEIFLSEREESGAGSCVTVVMEGTRPVLVEVQALVVGSELPVPRRVAQGVDVRRVQILLGVLQKHARVAIDDKDVFVKVTGGLNVKEPAIDLAICMAVASSAAGKPIANIAAAVGEVGLLGEIRSVTFLAKREKEAKKLGYTSFYSRESCKKVSELVKLLK
ncbi:MAG: DNA repair protein RadA [bacterium]